MTCYRQNTSLVMRSHVSDEQHFCILSHAFVGTQGRLVIIRLECQHLLLIDSVTELLYDLYGKPYLSIKALG